MRVRDWSIIDAVVAELDRLLSTADRPGNHPDTLQRIERCVSIIDAANVALDQCFALRMTARTFYAAPATCRSAARAGCSIIEVAQALMHMRNCIARIRMDLARLKDAREAQWGQGRNGSARRKAVRRSATD